MQIKIRSVFKNESANDLGPDRIHQESISAQDGDEALAAILRRLHSGSDHRRKGKKYDTIGWITNHTVRMHEKANQTVAQSRLGSMIID